MKFFDTLRSVHAGMIHRPSRRDLVKTAAKVAAAGALGVGRPAVARGPAPAGPAVGTFSHIDSLLRAATGAGAVPGVVALAATDDGVVYEGIFGRRRLPEGPAMTRDTVFRVASMVKLITSVAALQLVERGPLSSPRSDRRRSSIGSTRKDSRTCARQSARSSCATS